MTDYPPSRVRRLEGYPPRGPNRFTLALIVLAAFVIGAWAERRWDWLPGISSQEPASVRKTFAPFWQAWRLVDDQYVDREAVKPERMTEGAIAGMLASLGDVGHTTYLTPEEWQRFQQSLQGNYTGIGARMTVRNNQPTVVNTFPNAPAAKDLRPGDVFLKVDGKSVRGMSLEQVVQWVRGPEGTVVHLQIRRASATDLPSFGAGAVALAGTGPWAAAAALLVGEARQGKVLDVAIERQKLEIPDVTWHLLPPLHPDDPRIAHVAILDFYQNTDDQLRDAVSQAKAKGARGLLVDVRGNGGGLKDQAVKVSSEFLASGLVFQERDAKGNITDVPVNPAKPGPVATEIPITVLIDSGSASSSEIFAGAIQDHKRGKLVGTRTFGTGTVLGPFPLEHGSAGGILLAVKEWLTANGRQIWKKGIEPDVKVTLPPGARLLVPDEEDHLTAADLAATSDKQLLEALKVLTQTIRAGKPS